MRVYKGKITELEPNQVFTFGSNLYGFHGAGAAGFASFGIDGNKWRDFDYADKPNGWKGKWNVKGIGEGLQEGTHGKSYALPTVTQAGYGQSLSKEQIKTNIDKLYSVAKENPDLDFLIAYTCDGKPLLNGWSIYDMAELFYKDDIPENIVFEERFGRMVLDNNPDCLINKKNKNDFFMES